MSRLLIILAPLMCCAQSFTITTVAGSLANQLQGGFSGDGGPAVGAQLQDPTALAMDSSGNLYIWDWGNYRIRKVSGGIITTIAGTGLPGPFGDGSAALKAELEGPGAIALDKSGNLYVAGNYVIRKINPAGIISAFAGNYGNSGFSGDGGPAIAAEFSKTAAVAVDSSGNVYVADYWNGAVRKISTDGTISTMAGQGTIIGYSGDGGPATAAVLGYPSGLAFDTKGNLYIADTLDNVVRMVDTTGVITTVAGNYTLPHQSSGDGGQATSAAFYGISGIAVDASGNLFVGDYIDGSARGGQIREVLPDGKINTVAGNGNYPYQGDGGLATNAGVDGPHGLLAAGSNIYFSDTGHSLVRLLTPGAPISGPPPVISKGGVVTSASASSVVEPGSWASIYGTNLVASSKPVSWNGDFPLVLGGTTVTINDVPAYLSYVSATQVNLQAPDGGLSGTVNVTLTTANGTASSTVTLGIVSPAFSLLGDGKHAAAIILRSDGSGSFGGGTYDVVGPSGTSLGYKTVPAKAGDNVVFFGVGFGNTSPDVPAGQPFSGAAYADSAVHLTINGQPLTTTFAGMSAPGLFQFNLTIPQGLGTGDQSLLATVNGVSTQANVVTTLQ
jgi:uncharacterized protein (TIGR03437 family)